MNIPNTFIKILRSLELLQKCNCEDFNYKTLEDLIIECNTEVGTITTIISESVLWTEDPANPGEIIPGSGGNINWDLLTNVPATFPPAIHNHNLSDLADVDNTAKAVGYILKVDADGITHKYVLDETGTDEKVKYNVDDPTAGYLETKIIAGTNISVTEGTGVDENKLKINNTYTYVHPTTHPMSIIDESAVATDTPIDASRFHFWDTVNSLWKSITASNFYIYLKDKFDLLYAPIADISKWEYILYDDWYLPSADELENMMIQKAHIPNFTLGYYNSSTEHATNNTRYTAIQLLPVGYSIVINSGKGALYYVRPIRYYRSTDNIAIGTATQGGVVFYKMTDFYGAGDHKYIIAANENAPTDLSYGTSGITTGATATAVGAGLANTTAILVADPTSPSALYCTGLNVRYIQPKEVSSERPEVAIEHINPVSTIDTPDDLDIFSFWNLSSWKNITWIGFKSALGLSITATKTLTVTEDTTLSGGTHSGTNTGDQDLSGLKLKPNVVSITSSATITPTGNFQENEVYATALVVDTEFQIPANTPANGNRILVRIDAVAEQNLTYNAIYSGNMPDIVEAGIPLYMEFIYNSTSSKWEYIESGGGGHEIYSQEEVTPVEQRKLLRFKGFLQAIDNALSEETEVEIDDALTSTFEGVVEVNVRVELDDTLGRNLVDDEWTSNFFDRDGEESQKGTYGDWHYVCIYVDTWVRYPINKDVKDLFHTDTDVITSLEDEDNWTTDNEYDPFDLPAKLGYACCHVNKNADVSTLYMIINAGSGDVARIRTYPSHVNRLAEEDVAEHGILALTDLHGVAHSGIPAGYIIDSIIIKETSNNSAGNVSIGTTAGATDVVNALSVGALAEVLATLGTTFFSTTTAQNLYVSSSIGAVIEFSVNAGGTDYTVDDVLTITGGNSDCTIKVLTIGGSGEVLTAEIVTAGTGYSIGDANAVTGGTGNDDCTIDIDNLGLADARITLKINIKKVW